MRIGHFEKRYVYPMGYRWVREAKSIGEITERVVFIGEDDEMKYYIKMYGKGLWGVRKGGSR